MRVAAVGQREREERGEAGEIGEADGRLQLRERVLVRPLLDVARRPVRVDPDDLEKVACPFGVLQRPQVVGVVGASVAVERGEHRENGVRGRERLRVAGGCRDREGTLRVCPALVRLSPQPVGARPPREEQRLVAGCGSVEIGPRVQGERLVEPAAEVVDDPDPPGEPRRQRPVSGRDPVEGRESSLPVSLDLASGADELLDVRVPPPGGEQVGRSEHGLRSAGAQKRAAVVDEDAGDLVVVADRRERPQRLFHVILRLEPGRRRAVHVDQLCRSERVLLEDELADQPAEREPADLAAVELEEQPAPRQRPEQLRRAVETERLEQLRREAVERCDRADQPPDHRRLALEHLRREVGEEWPARIAHAPQCGASLAGRHRPQRFDRQPNRRGPAVGRRLERIRETVALAELGCDQRCGLVERERELGACELEHLALGAQPFHAERRLGPRREHDVEARGRLSNEALDERCGRPGGSELVEVVDDEYEVTTQLVGEDVADHPCQLPAP